jgi:archaellum biogenesis ATPase FlaH
MNFSQSWRAKNRKNASPLAYKRSMKRVGGGLHRGEIAVVGGETSGEKSVILSMAAFEIAERGKAVTVFSLEMPARTCFAASAAISPTCGSRVSRNNLLSGR